MVTFENDKDCVLWGNVVTSLVDHGDTAVDAVASADMIVTQFQNRRIDLDSKPKMEAVSSEAFTEAFSEKAKQMEECLRERLSNIHYTQD